MWVWFMCAGIANIIIKYGPIIKKKKKKKATRPTLFENFMLLQYNNFFFFALKRCPLEVFAGMVVNIKHD